MSRSNWLNIPTWAVPILCLIAAFSWGFYTWNKYTLTKQESAIVNADIAYSDRMLTQTQDELRKMHLQPRLTAVKSPLEPAEFYRVLPEMMHLSGVKMVRMEPKALNVLPTLGAAKPGGTTGSSSSSNGNKEAVNEVSLSNLPRGAQALSTQVALQGNYASIRNFLWRLNNYRYAVRAININDLTLTMSSEQKQLLNAQMTLTRFVAPPEKALAADIPPLATGESPLMTPGAPGTSNTGLTPAPALGRMMPGNRPAGSGALQNNTVR